MRHADGDAAWRLGGGVRVRVSVKFRVNVRVRVSALM